MKENLNIARAKLNAITVFMDSKARERLMDYIGYEYGAQKNFSKRTDVHEAALSRILQGKQLPSLENAVRIEKATRGKVRPKHWFEETDPFASSPSKDIPKTAPTIPINWMDKK